MICKCVGFAVRNKTNKDLKTLTETYFCSFVYNKISDIQIYKLIFCVRIFRCK